jgi:hypothetical protein
LTATASAEEEGGARRREEAWDEQLLVEVEGEARRKGRRGMR